MAGTKRVNLALQGGGSHGAFGWGVLDLLAEDGRLDIEGISGTSAGSLNAAVYAYGRMNGGNDGAREALQEFWRKVSEVGAMYSPVRRMPWEPENGWEPSATPAFLMFEAMTRTFSPYQFNPFNFNPLRETLAACVDFARLVKCECVELFVTATNVRTGHVRVFRNHEMTLDAVLASTCLPLLFQAVEIDGEHYWDGGYMGNPALYPLFYHTRSRDVVIVHINPIVRPDLPLTAPEIQNRLNEVTFNSSLLRELRVVAFVTKLIEEGWLKDEFRDQLKHVLIHSIRADETMCGLSVATKFHTEWAFLCKLRDLGRQAAASWLEENFDHLGKRSTVDLRKDYLDAPAPVPPPPARKAGRRKRVAD